jgi:hypothetical protein
MRGVAYAFPRLDRLRRSPAKVTHQRLREWDSFENAA